MEQPEGSLPRLQAPTTCPYPESAIIGSSMSFSWNAWGKPRNLDLACYPIPLSIFEIAYLPNTRLEHCYYTELFLIIFLKQQYLKMVSTSVLWLFTAFKISAIYKVFSLPQNNTDTRIFILLSMNSFLQFGRVSDMCGVTYSKGEVVFERLMTTWQCVGNLLILPWNWCMIWVWNYNTWSQESTHKTDLKGKAVHTFTERKYISLKKIVTNIVKVLAVYARSS